MSEVPTNFTEAATLFNDRLSQGTLKRGVKLGNNTYLTWEDTPEKVPGWFGVRLHQTNVVTFHSDGRIVLDSGGWHTVTTKDRMNRAIRSYHSSSSWSVYSDRGVWYVATGNYSAGTDKRWAYADGITLHLDGSVSGEGEDPRRQQQLRKQARAYAKAYTQALYDGEIPSPSGGDCWGCCMVPVNGKPASPQAGLAGPDHMLSHLEEKYYVPSLVLRALERFGGSQAAKHTVSCLLWPEEAPEGKNPWGGVVKDQIQKMVFRHTLEQLGLPA